MWVVRNIFGEFLKAFEYRSTAILYCFQYDLNPDDITFEEDEL
jgi:hypothetical protein